jgi:lysophospholipase L1-like esterase
MEATYGYRALTTRRCLGLFGCLIALVALSAMALPSAASAKHIKVKQTYVGLGDSLAFGYSQKIFNEHQLEGDPAAAFEGGYVQDYFKETANAGSNKGKVQLINLGCPGETTESFIGNNPGTLAAINAALKGKIPEKVTGEAPCAYHNTNRLPEPEEYYLPLHNEYGTPGKPTSTSQLEAALAYIGTANAEHKKVQLVSLNIGANDQLHAVAKIEGEVHAQIVKKVTELANAEGERALRKEVEAATNAYVKGLVEEQVFIKFVLTGIIKTEVEGYLFVTYIKPAARAGCEKISEEDFATPAFWEAICASEFSPGVTVEEALEFQFATTEPGKKLLEEEGAKKGAEIGAKDGEEYFAEHEGELEVKGFEFSGTYVAEHFVELSEIAKKAGEKFAFEYTELEPGKKELAEYGKKLFEQTLAATAPALFEQINVNITGIIATLRGAGYKGKISFQGGYDPFGENVPGGGEILPHSNELLAALNAAEKSTVTAKKIKACFYNPQPVFNPLKKVPPGAEFETLFAFTEMHQVPFDIHPTPTGYKVLAGLQTSCPY